MLCSVKCTWDGRNASLSSTAPSSAAFAAQPSLPLASEEDPPTLYIKSFPLINKTNLLLYWEEKHKQQINLPF